MKKNRLAGVTLGMVLTSVALAACGGEEESADGLTTVSWAQPTPESMAYHPYVLADELGYFEEEGLKVDLAPASEDLATTTLVSNGSADIAAASANEIFYAVDSGADLSVVYDAMTLSPEGIVVPEDSDVQSMADLAGTKIGVPSEEEKSLVGSALAAVGVDTDEVTFVTIGGSGQVLADQLDKGEIAAFGGSLLDFSAVEAVGYPLRDITPDEIRQSPGGAIVVKPDADEEVIEGFLRAFARATAFAEEDPERTEEILRERIPEEWQNEEVADALLASGLELWAPIHGEYGAINPDVWEAAQARLVASEDVGGDLDLGALLDDSLVAGANEGW